MSRRFQGIALFSPVLLCGPLSSGAAQEFCVTCTDPDAVYRCAIQDGKPGGAQPLQLRCVTALAKEGGHATCSIKHGTVFECDGPLKRIPSSASDSPPPPSQVVTGKSGEASQAGQPPPPQTEPRTVVELAKQASDATSNQMKKAGQSVANSAKTAGEVFVDAMKKSWECLSSLFFRCGAGR
jgi:hypothetical protein